ncbi:unnamed protein product [Laminaria digitata]
MVPPDNIGPPVVYSARADQQHVTDRKQHKSNHSSPPARYSPREHAKNTTYCI